MILWYDVCNIDVKNWSLAYCLNQRTWLPKFRVIASQCAHYSALRAAAPRRLRSVQACGPSGVAIPIDIPEIWRGFPRRGLRPSSE